MTEQEALHIVRNPWGHSAHEQHEAALRLADGVELLAQELDEAKRKLNETVTHAQHLQNCVDSQILEYRAEVENSARKDAEIRRLRDKLIAGGNLYAIEFERAESAEAELKASHDRLLCTCPPEWTAQCQSRACPRHRTKDTRDWL